MSDDYTREEFQQLIEQRDKLERDIKSLSIERDSELQAVRDSIADKCESLHSKLLALENSIQPQLSEISDRYAAEISNLNQQLTELRDAIDPKLDAPPAFDAVAMFARARSQTDWKDKEIHNQIRRISRGLTGSVGRGNPRNDMVVKVGEKLPKNRDEPTSNAYISPAANWQGKKQESNIVDARNPDNRAD
jgi:hypothetical protein